MSVLARLSQHLQPLRVLLPVFLESACPLCEASCGTGICLPCQRQIRRCQLNSGRMSTLKASSDQLPVFAWGGYQGQLRQAIAALKYQQQPAIAQFLGSELGRQWSLHPMASHYSQPAVVPIPLHPDRLKQRGYNQAELLAHWFCRTTQLRHCPHGLIRIRATTAQHQLNAAQRQQNLAGAFALGEGLARTRSVLLLDDIYTTGATAQAAAKTLENQGIEVIGISVIAQAISSAASVKS